MRIALMLVGAFLAMGCAHGRLDADQHGVVVAESKATPARTSMDPEPETASGEEVSPRHAAGSSGSAKPPSSTPDRSGTEAFSKAAREKLDQAELLIKEADFDHALELLRGAETFDPNTEPRRREELRARAIELRDSPAVQAAAKARREEDESRRAKEVEVEARAREAAAAEFAAERDRKAKESYASANELLRAGKISEAVAEARKAESAGLDISKLMSEAAARDWRERQRDLTGEELATFIGQWGVHAPREASKRLEREVAAYRKQARIDQAQEAQRAESARIASDRREAPQRLQDARVIWLPIAKNWVDAYAKAMGAYSDPRSLRGKLRESQVQALLAAKEKATPTMSRITEFWRTTERLAHADECARAAEQCAKDLGLAQFEFDYLTTNMERLLREAISDRRAALSE